MSHFPLLGLYRKLLGDALVRSGGAFVDMRVIYRSPDIGLLHHLDRVVPPAINYEAGRHIVAFSIKPYLSNHGLNLL